MTIAEQISRAKADYDAVYEAGKQSEYDRIWNAFWDDVQANGTRTAYQTAFSYLTPKLLPPKYDIRPANAQNLFASNRYIQGDARKLFGDAALDLSNATRVDYAFNWTGFTALGTMDFSKATVYYEVFGSSYNLETIELLIMPTQQSYDIDWFNSCRSLKYITIQGEIANNINLKWSPLVKSSIESVITHLSTTVSGKTLTLMKSAVNTAFETSSGAADGSNSDEWKALVTDKPNWTISLV